MDVASPKQSRKPVEYWLGGLKATELVQLWEFLSRNLDEEHCDATLGRSAENLPTSMEVEKHIYSESLPSHFYACKDRGGLRPSEPLHASRHA